MIGKMSHSGSDCEVDDWKFHVKNALSSSEERQVCRIATAAVCNKGPNEDQIAYYIRDECQRQMGTSGKHWIVITTKDVRADRYGLAYARDKEFYIKSDDWAVHAFRV